MQTQAEWMFLEAEALAESNPDFFRCPLRSLDDRQSILPNELVKLPVRLDRSGATKLYARWVIVDEVHAVGEYSGYLMQGYSERSQPPNDRTERLTFSAANIYRMPPRTFTLWGTGEVPNTIYGGTNRPELEDGSLKPNCEEQIEHFAACGWDDAKVRYSETRNGRPEWPSVEELWQTE